MYAAATTGLEVGAGGLQYTWHAKLQTPRGRYEVGFFLFGAEGATPEQTGNIKTLLLSGQFSAFVNTPGGSSSVDPDVRVTGNYAGGFLTITVTVAPSVKQLFGQRPTSCDLFTQYPHQKSSSKVPIQYASN